MEPILGVLVQELHRPSPRWLCTARASSEPHRHGHGLVSQFIAWPLVSIILAQGHQIASLRTICHQFIAECLTAVTCTHRHKTGWGGYSWNRSLFPDPAGFLNSLHSTSTAADGGNPLGHPLKVLLNVHPGSIGHEEDRFVQFAHALVRLRLVSDSLYHHYKSPPS